MRLERANGNVAHGHPRTTNEFCDTVCVVELIKGHGQDNLWYASGEALTGGAHAAMVNDGARRGKEL